MTGRELALLAEDYLVGKLEFWEFMRQAPAKPKNSDAWDLVDMIEHEPTLCDSDGVLSSFGVKYRSQVVEIIQRLKCIDDEL
jgi:hypothetical protein